MTEGWTKVELTGLWQKGEGPMERRTDEGTHGETDIQAFYADVSENNDVDMECPWIEVAIDLLRKRKKDHAVSAVFWFSTGHVQF